MFNIREKTGSIRDAVILFLHNKRFIQFFTCIISFTLLFSGCNKYLGPDDMEDSSFTELAYGKDNPKDDNEEVIIEDPKIKAGIDDFVEWMETHTGSGYNAPSAVIVLIHKNRVILKRAFKTTRDRLYDAASHTKFFTLLAVLQLSDKGIINIDKPLSNYLPIDLTMKGSAPVTIRHILSHTSGYKGGSKQCFKTGRGYFYFNGGYNLLAQLVSAYSGKPISDYVRENILIPLGMPNADPDKMTGAGSFKWSLEDMTIFLKLLHGKGQYRGRRIIAEHWFADEIYKPVRAGLPLAKNKTYRGICFRVLSIDDRPYSINHAALWPGSGGFFHSYPKHDISFIVMTDSPTADLLDNWENAEKEEDEAERAKLLSEPHRIYIDPYFAGWYFPFCRAVYKFIGILSDADINPKDYKDTRTSDEIMARYPGRYVNPITGDLIDITAKNYHIEAASPLFGDKTLLSSGPSRFFPRDGDKEFFFVPSSSGKMQSLVYDRKLFIRNMEKDSNKQINNE